MSTLGRKLIRTIQSTGGQFLALVVVVALGVLIYLGMSTAFYNLSRSQEVFYEDNRFADYTFQVVKAPESVVARVEALPGVVKATGRIQKDVPIVKEGNQRATGRLTGYPLPMEGEVNRLQLLSGRWFDLEAAGPAGVIVDPQYALAQQLQPGDLITVIADGKKVDLTVLGTGTSPEFVYPMKDAGSLIPEPERFGIIMMPQVQLQQILGYPGQINQLAVDLAAGADEKIISGQIEEILRPYGNIASYPRKDQLSHAALQSELDGLKMNSRFLPLIFFLIAAAIQFVILSRLVKSQRLSIGVMKALGYDDRRIIRHYTGYAVAVGICGAVVGTLLGIAVASVMSDLYARFFNLPHTIGGLNVQVVIYSLIICMVVGIASGGLASRSVIKIHPAEAMRPEPPAAGRYTPLEGWSWLWSRLDSGWKLSLRSIFRNRVRFAVTVLGVMSSVVLLILALFTNDAVDFLMDQNFRQVNHYDYMVRFTEPVSYSQVLDWTRWDEMQTMEPVLEVPVKIHGGDRSEDELVVGLQPGSRLKKIYDKQGRQREVPAEGMLLSNRTADELGVEAGDVITVETTLGRGPNRISQLTVAGIYEPMTSTGSYVAFTTANRLLGEREVSSAMLLKLDAAVMPAVEERLHHMNGVSSVMNPRREQETFVQMLDSMVYSIGVMILLAGLLGLAIVYNTSTLAFQERRRELASLRVLGYSRREVAGLLRKETWVQAALGILIGLPAGKAMGAAYIAGINTDLFSLPAVIYPRTYFIAAVTALIFAWLGQHLSIRRIDQLDMVEALKNRD